MKNMTPISPGKRTHRRSWPVALSVLVLLAAWALPASAITFGELDGNRHPNVGALVIYVPGSEPFPICSGTLVHPRLFLTAGHCTSDLQSLVDAGAIYVTFNTDPYVVADLRPVSAAYTDPEFRAVGGGASASKPFHDIGALVLREPALDLAPAILPPVGLLDALKDAHQLLTGPEGTKFTVVGYGTLLSRSPPVIDGSPTPRRVAQSAYSALNESWLKLSQNNARGYGGTGYGDSGGPTFWKGADGTEILVGITSTGDPNTLSTGVYYRLDTIESLSFIAAIISTLQ